MHTALRLGVRVALAGCGTVGGELVRILHHAADEIRLRHGLRFELTSVLVAHPGRPRPDELDRALLTTDVDAFLAATHFEMRGPPLYRFAADLGAGEARPPECVLKDKVA